MALPVTTQQPPLHPVTGAPLNPYLQNQGNIQAAAAPGLQAPGARTYTPTVPVASSPGGSAANPNAVQISPDILNSMQQYQDAAYKNQTATLDPQFAQQKQQFDAQMAAQGLQPGSQAYNQAYQQMQQAQNGAYSQAYNNSFQTGLGAQNQAFNQGYDNSQLANALAIANINANAQTESAGIGANASMYGSDASKFNNSQNNATNQLLGLGNLGLGYGNLQQQGQQNNFNDMLGLSGLMNGTSQYNNGLIGGAQNTLLGMIPNSNPAPVDVTGAYGLNQAGQNAQYQGQVASANGTNQMVGQLGSAAVMMAMMMCAHEVKNDHGPVDSRGTLEAIKGLPLHQWSYKGEETIHVGTFARQFNESLGLPQTNTIATIDMLGALLGCMKELIKRVEALEAP